MEAVCKEFDTIKVQGGIIAKKVALNAENVASVLNYGQRMYALVVCQMKKEMTRGCDGDLYVDGYTPRVKPDALDPDTVEEISALVRGNNMYAWLVGAAVQEIMVRGADGNVIKIIGNDPFANKHTITISDMYAFYSYNLNIMEGSVKQMISICWATVVSVQSAN